MATEKRLIDAYLNGEVPKIKTHFAEIIVRGKTEKPYYNIIFIDPQTREYEVCFGSYSIKNVRKWLSEKFEIVDAPTVDAVEVVRCKDCKYFAQGEPYDPCECMKWMVKFGVAYTTPDGYCHKAERKDENP